MYRRLALKNHRHNIDKDRHFHIFNGGNQKCGARVVAAWIHNKGPHHGTDAWPAATGGECASGRGNRHEHVLHRLTGSIFNGHSQLWTLVMRHHHGAGLHTHIIAAWRGRTIALPWGLGSSPLARTKSGTPSQPS